MAEEHARWKQYEYAANSNLVLTSERRARDNEPTGEAETLAGKRMHKMGDRVHRSKPINQDEKKKKIEKRRAERAEKDAARKKAKAGGSVLADSVIEPGSYRPKTEATRAAYEQLLHFLSGFMGEQPADILRGAADEILAVLKDDALQGPPKQKACEMLLSSMSSDKFAELMQIGTRITDFYLEDVEGAAGEAMDENLGVSVVFDEEDEQEDEDEDELRDEEDDDEDGVGDEELKRTVIGLRDEDDDMPEEQQKDDYIDPLSLDAYWLQRQMKEKCGVEDDNDAVKMAKEVLNIMQDTDEREIENRLVILLDYDKFDFIKLLLANRTTVVYCTLLGQAQDDTEKDVIQEKMKETAEGRALLHALTFSHKTEGERKREMEKRLRKEIRGLKEQGGTTEMELDDAKPSAGGEADTKLASRTMLDLESLAFAAGGHLMANKRCELPQGSQRVSHKGYEEVLVPAVTKMDEDEVLKRIDSLPEWVRPAFKSTETLNRIQTKVCDAALFQPDNMLVCAPTGAGKTNVALLAMLHEIGLHRKEDGTFNLEAFKIIYLAPMKALVAEIVGNFAARLEDFGIVVKEFTGDVQLNKQQLAEANVIVMTPEKYDVITRKGDARPFTRLVRLVVIDEIHLLHDGRGPVLESLIARTIRQIETTQELVRLVGLSATLPNYEDVAALLRVKADSGLFHFDNSYRPVPLEQQYIGVTEKKALKRFQLMNEITYDKVMAAQGSSNQVIVFVHSRKETAKTGRAIRTMAEENDTLQRFMVEDSVSQQICREMADTVKNPDLKELLPFGFGIHHAGMARSDRELVESLFNDGHIQVLVSTATLAWGVNLPAHTVIIKGTQIYSPDKGRWVELSALDVMQMMGRAGRPQFDTSGTGIIITTYSELQYYLSLLNQQLPIESQMVKELPDLLNAEVVLGTVQSMRDAVNWLGYTYLYIRMLRNPSLYGVSADEVQEDAVLEQRRLDLAHTAATALFKANLVKYDRKTGNLQTTDLGRVASYFYVSYTSISAFNDHLKPAVSDIELLRIFSLAGEFKNMVVREEEKMELQKLADRVPIPIKESIEEPTAKVNVLLQSYISQLKLDGFALLADMVYITQSAGRLFRALFEMVLRRGWASLTLKCLNLCKMIDKRMWGSMIPLRQFKSIPDEIIKKLEKKDVIQWERFFDMSPQEIGELIRYPKMGKTIHRLIHQFPKLELSAHVQPVTRNVLKVELTITPDFQWDDKIHGAAELFHVFVEDVDQETVLHSELFILKGRYIEEEHLVSLTVPMSEPVPPQYFVRVVSDRWLGAETVLPISFRHLILPEKFPPRTELLDLQPLPVSALRNPAYEAIYAKTLTTFNAIQTQVHNTLYNTSDNALVAAPAGSGKTVCAEFALLRAMNENAEGKCVYVAPMDALVKERYKDWSAKFAGLDMMRIAMLTGETSADLKLLDKSNVVLSTPEAWDMISRRWKQRKNVQNVRLMMVDEIHLIGGEKGPVLEVITSRMRYIASQTDNKTRIVALSASVANAKDLGEWIGAGTHSLYNFHPNVRPIPLEIHIQGFDIPHYASRLLAMSKPMYAAIVNHSPNKPAMVVVADRKQARISAFDIMAYAGVEEEPLRFLGCTQEDLQPFLDKVKDKTLKETLPAGVALMHDGLSTADQQIVQTLFASNAAMVLVAARNMCWGMTMAAHLVIIMGTEFYDGREHRYCSYPVTDVLQMMGRAGRQGQDPIGKAVILCHTPKKEFYKKFLHEPVPVESHLDHFLHDHISAEIVTKVIENKQEAVDYLTWTFYYRRLTLNPNYYNMTGTTHRHISDHLSELVENLISDLEQSKCIAVEEDGSDVSALNLGMIAAYYYIRYTTIELFNSSLNEKTKIKGIIEILTSASEFDNLPMRHGEEKALRQLAAHVPLTNEQMKYTDPHTKAFLLLQAHLSRMPLAGDLAMDQKAVLREALRLIQAMVDVMSSSGWLKPALAAMEVSQMVVQALWDSSPNLMQLPHVTQALATACGEVGVETVFDLMDMEDEDRTKLLQMPENKLAALAGVCNRYPNVSLEYEVVDADEVAAGDAVQVQVKLERENEGDVGPVHAPNYPKEKEEAWWLLVGDPTTNQLLSIKRVSLQRKATVKLDFTAPEEVGKKALTLFLMCDAWAGCDQEYEFTLDVGEAMEEDD